MRAARIIRERTTLRPAPSLETAAAGTAVPVKPSSSARSAIVWGGLGFLTGAAFWHAVGFWGFVTEVVLNGNADVHATTALAQVPPAMAADAPGTPMPTFYLVSADNCTALALDRPTKRTLKLPCPQSGLTLRLEPAGKREGLAGLTAEPRLQTIGYRRE